MSPRNDLAAYPGSEEAGDDGPRGGDVDHDERAWSVEVDIDTADDLIGVARRLARCLDREFHPSTRRATVSESRDAGSGLSSWQYWYGEEGCRFHLGQCQFPGDDGELQCSAWLDAEGLTDAMLRLTWIHPSRGSAGGLLLIYASGTVAGLDDLAVDLRDIAGRSPRRLG